MRTLYDLPAGTFLSFYAGEILNDEDANRRGVQKNMGDVYFTALDFVASLNPSSSPRKPRPVMNMNNGNHVNDTNTTSDSQQNGSKFYPSEKKRMKMICGNSRWSCNRSRDRRR